MRYKGKRQQGGGQETTPPLQGCKNQEGLGRNGGRNETMLLAHTPTAIYRFPGTVDEVSLQSAGGRRNSRERERGAHNWRKPGTVRNVWSFLLMSSLSASARTSARDSHRSPRRLICIQGYGRHPVTLSGSLVVWPHPEVLSSRNLGRPASIIAITSHHDRSRPLKA